MKRKTNYLSQGAMYHGKAHSGYIPQSQNIYARKRRVVAIPRQRFATLPANQPTARHVSGSEVKAVDSGLIATLVPSAGVMYALNLVQEGSSFYNRIGRRIAMKSIELKGWWQPVAGTLNTVIPAGLVRVMVVYDRQPNGALPAMSDVLLDYDQSGNTTTTVESGLNLNNRDRFSVVLDHRKLAPQATQTGTTGEVTAVWPVDGAFQNNDGVVLQEYRKLKGIEAHYKASSNPSVIGDVATGALLLVLISSTINNNAWQLVLDTRLRFWDD